MTDHEIPGCPACGKPGVIYHGGRLCSVEWCDHEQWCPLREDDPCGPYRSTDEEAIAAATMPTCAWSLDESEGVWYADCEIGDNDALRFCPNCRRRIETKEEKR